MNPPYQLHASLGYRLSLSARLQERRLDEALKAIGLTRITWCVLLAIGNEALRRPSEIAHFVGIDRTATSRALRQLESDAVIHRASGGSDGRTRSVELTPKGARLLAKGTPMAIANNAIMEGRLTLEERDVLLLLLNKINEGEDTSLAIL